MNIVNLKSSAVVILPENNRGRIYR